VSDGIRGRRDFQSDQWNWTTGGRQKPPWRRPPWLPLIATAAGIVLLGSGLGLFLFYDDGGESDSAAFNPSPSAVRTATGQGTSEPSPEPSPTATAPPANDITVQLLTWSRQQSRWLAGRLDENPASYRESESVPLLVRLEGAVDGATYEITMRYQCGTDERASFDYLSQVAEADAPALLTAPGPGRTRPDTTIPIPDDPSIAFDDVANRRFLLWEGSFGAAPEGPHPSSQCTDTKEFQINVTAHNSAVFLMTGAHLAAAVDWGEGRGASSQDAPLFTEVSVDGAAPVRLEVTPGAVTP
jgi:hypothetical protein